ncbi:beta-ketoacyl synthase N-terminal-like domain-containing protein [Nocardia nepalensis]|uniref:beta-ketoacyl synthase N-terminal-like domain-containing protein n=1 Tax=Nocardia nepalensis TaxID=3375448 RepID=UPI003B6707BD
MATTEVTTSSIVGMACHIGPLENLDDFEQAVHAGESMCRMLPTRHRSADARRRLLSHVADSALRDAGFDRDAGAAAPRRIAVLIVHDGTDDAVDMNEKHGPAGDLMANQVCADLNFNGPASTIVTDSAGGVAALQTAARLLIDETIEAVLVGAVNVAFEVGLEDRQIGEGAVVLVLTRPARTPARREYAQIEAVSTRRSIDAEPRRTVSAELEVMRQTAREALARAGITAADVSYLEAHASEIRGEENGEIQALASVYSADGAGADSCALGSVQEIVGDAGTASALLGVVKAALCLYHRYLPGSPAGRAGGPEHRPAMDASVFYIPAQSRPWLRESSTRRRYAAVNALGSGGHSHIVLSSRWPAVAERPATWARGGGHLLLPIGADDLPGLLADLTRWRELLEDACDAHALVREAAAALGESRLRVVLVAAHRETLLREVERAIGDLPSVWEQAGEWTTPAGSYFTARPIGAKGKVAFVYPGAFNAYLGLGQNLFRIFPDLLSWFEDQVSRPSEQFRDRILYPRGSALGRRQLMAREAELLADIPAMLEVGIQFAMFHTKLLLGMLGVPHGAFGYSLGETSMMFATGVWRLSARDDARTSRTPIFRDRIGGPKHTVRQLWNLPESVADADVWATHVLLADAAIVREVLAGFDRVYLTHVNTPREVVIAGDPEQCRRVIEAVGGRAARAPANHVLHCPVVDGELAELAELHRYPTGERLPVELLSACAYDRIEALDSDTLAQDIARTLAGTVDFPRLVRAAYDRGYRCFVEVGPGATCTRWINATLEGEIHLAVAVDRRGASTGAALSQALARLLGHGLPVDLSVLYESPAPPATEPPDAAIDVKAPPPMITEPVVTCPDLITFEGEPFGYVPSTPAPPSEPVEAPTPLPRLVPPPPRQPSPAIGETRAQSLLRELREQVLATHLMAMQAQQALQHSMVAALERQVNGSVDPQGSVAPQPLDQASPDLPARGTAPGVIWDEKDVLEFANGSVAAVFGPQFAPIDGYATRVRLPQPPYMFVTRVTELEATTGRFEPSFIRAEYDVPRDAWYTVDGQVPAAVAAEAAGQSKFLLLGYLGIDFRNQGSRVYRVLGGTLKFHRELPHEGQTLRYDLWIDRFVWNGDTPLVFFHCRGYVDDELLLELENAGAGFFTEAELNVPGGVVTSDSEDRRRAKPTRTSFKPLAYTARQHIGPTDLDLLAGGQVAQVFGAPYDQDGCNPSLRLTGQRLRMVDEVTVLDRCGGRRGLGSLTAVKRLTPDDWYFRCHFRDDPVVPGSLLGAGCVQILQVYALYLGLQLCLPDARFQPMTGLQTQVKVRGQITPDCRMLRYEADITEVTLVPRPTVIADILIYDGDRPLTSIRNLGIQLREKPGTPYRPETGGIPTAFLGRTNERGERALTNELHMAHLGKGDLVIAMGPEFEIYRDSRTPHFPNGDLQCVDRIMTLQGTRRQLLPGATMSAEYDSPADAWYYRDNSYPSMPNCIYMETALQGAFLLGYYLGATLDQPGEQFSFRNLDGRATLVEDIDLRGKTIRQRSRLLTSHAMPGTVLQNFSFDLSVDGQVCYVGEALGGYFNERALAHQIGLDSGTCVAPWLDRQDSAPETVHRIDLGTDPAPYGGDGAHLELADGQLRLVDRVDIVPGGGDFHAGYLRGYRQIRPDEWYFDYHFHRDPVMPGSLGVEAIIQALQLYVMQTGLAEGIARPRFAMARGVEMSWKYRGQILRENRDMDFEAHIKEVRREDDRLLVIAEANLWKSGMRIYEVHDVAVEVRPTDWKGERS